MKLTVVIIMGYYCYQLHKKVVQYPSLGVKSIHTDEIIGDHQSGYRRDRSTTDQIFCSCHIMEKRCEYNETAQFFRFLILYAVGSSLWTEDVPVAT
jgi:hypothetical protein